MRSTTVLDSLFHALWQSYTQINPEAENIHQLFSTHDTFANDHIALRTFDHPKVGIEVMARTFVTQGYQAKDRYTFPNKHLIAQHFEHPDYPLVFISAFDINTLSARNQEAIHACIDAIPPEICTGENFSNAGRPWQASHSQYQALLAESEYAAWLYAFGFMANHFTVSVNDLSHFNQDLAKVNQALKDQGYALNIAGGEIKGTPADLLEQSSTKASIATVLFSDKTADIPGCYYEFAKRHKQENGELFQGFIAQSADKIFESTDTK